MSNENTRQPILAGQYYPSDPDTLRSMIDNALNEYNDVTYENPFAVIAPADNYSRAFPFYTYTYAQLKPYTYDSIILISGIHKKAYPGIILPEYDKFSSPLGELTVDKEACEHIQSVKPELIIFDDEYHKTEHSIELQLPFLSYLFGTKTKIIPIIIGESNTRITLSLANAFKSLYETTKKNYLIIPCTNLSMGINHEEACIFDKRFVDYLLEFNPDYFSEQLAMREIIADGGAAVTALMRFAEMVGKKDVRLLELKNTGDMTGEKIKVTGYISASLI